MSLINNDDIRRKKGIPQLRHDADLSSSIAEAQRIVYEQVPKDRPDEILRYLRLFGYQPDKTVIQVHITGFFNKKKSSEAMTKEGAKRQAAINRYGGTTFVVIGRTHDPSIMNLVTLPRKKSDQVSPGYVGYLWKNKDPYNRAPHNVIPLDFTPIHISYPEDWKKMFATKGFMLALHVPSSFAKNKNKLTRALYRISKKVNVKHKWNFIDEIRANGFEQSEEISKSDNVQDPLKIIKVRLAKGQITFKQYEELYRSLTG